MKPGREGDYEAWLPKIVAALRLSPGFLGFENLRPMEGLQDEHVLILRFVDEPSLHGWEASPERKRWLAEATAFTAGAVGPGMTSALPGSVRRASP